MAYEPYADLGDYFDLLPDAEEITEEDLRQASRHIDSLTYNRIVAAGFRNLTQFQQDIIKEVCCRQALFEMENRDIINSILSTYSINGVSMSIGGSWNTFTQNGVVMQKDAYALLQQTGLCCRLLK